MAFLFSDSLFDLPVLNTMGRIAGTLLPDHFDGVDCLFAIITLFLIIKFVNSLRPILGE